MCEMSNVLTSIPSLLGYHLVNSFSKQSVLLLKWRLFYPRSTKLTIVSQNGDICVLQLNPAYTISQGTAKIISYMANFVYAEFAIYDIFLGPKPAYTIFLYVRQKLNMHFILGVYGGGRSCCTC